MAMSKKDFIAIAKAIACQVEHTNDLHTLALVARDIADHCAATNVAFDRHRFLTACGVQPALYPL